MPNCFQLSYKGQSEPVNLKTVDEEICAHFGVAPDDEHWYLDWFNWIGFLLAIGDNWDTIRIKTEKWEDASERDSMLKLIAYMRDKYDFEAWYEYK